MIQQTIHRKTSKLLIFAIVCLTAGCKQRTSSDVKADFIDKKPSADQTWTESRMISLNTYAADLLNFSGNEKKQNNELQKQVDDAFKAAQVTTAAPLSVYQLKLGPLDECFGENRGDYSVWWNSHRDQIKKQLEEAAWFIRDVHIKMLGQTGGAFGFREVIICPEEKIGAKMRLDGYQLRIGVPYSSFGNYKPIPNNAANGQASLTALWQTGAPIGYDAFDTSWWTDLKSFFSKKDMAQKALAAVWRIFNPLSPIRVSIRKVLHESGVDIRSKIAAILKQSVADNSTKVDPEKVRQGLLDEIIGSEPSGMLVAKNLLSEDVMTAFRQLQGDQIEMLARNWTCAAMSTTKRSEIENEATSVMQREMRNEKNYIRKEVHAGLVAVVNHHRIGVNIQAGTGAYAKFMPIETARETKIITNTTAGLVAVDTSDDISVDLNFALSLGKTLPTIAFEQAVRATASGRTLCN